VTTTSLPTTTTTPGCATACGVPLSGGEEPTASDALFVLKTAVGSVGCDLCSCDVDASGSVTATDALSVLKRAVGQAVELTCPVA
jgi:hypothetical protein